MSITYNTTLKNTRLQDVADAIDDPGSPGGSLKIGTTAMGTVLATIPLPVPCGTVSAGVLTFDTPVTDTSADNTGTAAAAAIYSSAATLIVSGLTVGVSASDIILTSVSVVATEPVTINSATITHG